MNVISINDRKIEAFEKRMQAVREALETINLYFGKGNAICSTLCIDGIYSTWYFANTRVANKALRNMKRRFGNVIEVSRCALHTREIREMLKEKNVICSDYI